METVTLETAKADLPHLVERAAAGEEIVIEQAGQKLAVLGPVSAAAREERTGQRPFGLLAGQVWISPDFNDPLPPDLQRAFDGEDP